ncbi:MAG: hypothetical protein JW754_00390 [Candidatus Aenigmarchaeota archaeon]|nr:hypothetical protein [Candidatus Aenigmarchaeota archaeon]
MKVSKSVAKDIILEVILFALWVGLVSTLYHNYMLLMGCLAFVLIVMLFLWHDKDDVYMVIAGAIIGPIAEIICVNAGAWSYAVPNIFGIPYWLPFAWGAAGLLLKRAVETYFKIK